MAKKATRKRKVGSDLEIARAAKPKLIGDIAAKLDIPAKHVFNYGPYKAKINLDYLSKLPEKPGNRMILVTGITPTPAGEGKTTTTVGLGDALNRLGYKSAICLREPSLGPCFGMKGGAAAGGYSQVIPMEDINLHFTGDFHAITSAHNLLSAMLDNHIYWGNELGIDARRIRWRRVVDLNDRALRSITQSLGGVANGFPREDGFDITVASEVMAVFCLANDVKDLQDRLGRIVVAETRDRKPVTAAQLNASGAMTVLLKEAIQPNLVQTLEGTPAFVHGGPFANIAHGCNSLIATKSARKLADYVVTEAGFGSDLGAEKFFDIKCRMSGMSPDGVVIVATIRALKMHGGVAKDELGKSNVAAVTAGLANLKKHVSNLKLFGVPVVVALNRFSKDTDAEVAAVVGAGKELDVPVVECNHWAEGGKGATGLAKKLIGEIDKGKNDFGFLYSDGTPLWEKIETIAHSLYGAAAVTAPDNVHRQIAEYQKQGYGRFPVCMAKTPLSFSADPSLLGAPEGHEIQIREVRLSAGAGFIVAICGNIMTMPGLPRVPAANNITLNKKGDIEGLF